MTDSRARHSVARGDGRDRQRLVYGPVERRRRGSVGKRKKGIHRDRGPNLPKSSPCPRCGTKKTGVPVRILIGQTVAGSSYQPKKEKLTSNKMKSAMRALQILRKSPSRETRRGRFRQRRSKVFSRIATGFARSDDSSSESAGDSFKSRKAFVKAKALSRESRLFAGQLSIGGSHDLRRPRRPPSVQS